MPDKNTETRRSTVGASPTLGPREVYEVGAILIAGLVVRLLVALVSRGTNDIFSWEEFADQIAEHGLLWMYGNVPLWNHPPLMGFMAEGLRALAPWLGWAFPPTFKLVPIAADGLSAFLIFRVWLARQGDYRTARRALVIFTLSLNAVLVSGYHGNTDSVVATLLLAACVAIERGRHFWGGTLLAAAINVKLIPVLLVPLLIARARPREIARFTAGLALGILPFLPVLWLAWDGFFSNAVAYRSNFDNWGVPLMLRTLDYVARHASLTDVVPFAAFMSTAYIGLGRSLIVLVVLATAAYARATDWSSAYGRAAIGLAVFLILTPGFGVQYTAIMGPVLLAFSLRWGAAWAGIAGIFLFTVYATFYRGGFPIYTIFDTPIRPAAALVGTFAWGLLVAFTWTELGQSWRARRAPTAARS